MEVLFASCPMCGARYDGALTSRHLVCDYCGAQFMLSKDEAEALGIGDAPVQQAQEPDNRSYDGSNLSMVDFARQECDDFLKHADEDEFEDTKKIRRGLELGGEEVFLIHDDTLFKSGKNGFAITEDGFVCKELLGDGLQRVSWSQLARDEPRRENGTAFSGERAIIYFTSDDDTMEDLFDLACRLARHAQKVGA